LELEHRARDPRAIASDAFARAMFSEAGYDRPSLGTPETVQRFDRDTIAAFHAERYEPSNSCVAVAGSFDADVVLDLLGAFTIPSAGRGRRSPPSPAVVAQPSPDVRVIDVPGATQAEIRIGQAVPVKGELVSPLEVLNAVLGDELTGRLARTVRYRLGLTYYIRSRIIARRLGSVFVVETSVAGSAAAAALAAIRGEIERLCDELVPRDELEQTKRRLVGTELRYLQDLTAVGASLGPVALRDNPGFATRRTQAIASATSEDLRELARRYLRPDRLVTVVAGPAALLPSQFSSGASAPLDSVS
jgi:zinc protease